MNINQAQYVISAPTVSKCPQDTKPEFAFIGRSNVGKSSPVSYTHLDVYKRQGRIIVVKLGFHILDQRIQTRKNP